MKKYLLHLLATIIVSLSSCSDDDGMNPITLKDRDSTTIEMYYPNETGYTFPLQGGDGKYSVKTGNDEVVTAEMISPFDLSLKAVGIGETTVTITDNSQNTLVLEVNVSYETRSFEIAKHDITIIGGDLTENEKKAISDKYLKEIPVPVGAYYRFVFTDKPNLKGDAYIQSSLFSSHIMRTTFELKETDGIIPESPKWGYEVIINNEKRLFVLGRYIPSTKATEYIPGALMENITEKVKKEYPKAELVYTSQVINRR